MLDFLFSEEQQDGEQTGEWPQQPQEQHGDVPDVLQQPERQPGDGQRCGSDRC